MKANKPTIEFSIKNTIHICFMEWNYKSMKWQKQDPECENHKNNVVSYVVTKEMIDKYKPKRNLLQKIKHWFYLRGLRKFTNPNLGELYENL